MNIRKTELIFLRVMLIISLLLIVHLCGVIEGMNKKIEAKLTYRNADGSVSQALPKQRQMTVGQKKYNLFWGARGPGKTDWLCYEGIANAMEIPNNYVLFGRFDLDEFRKTVLPRIEFLLPRNFVINHNQQDREFKLINGSIIGYTFLDESKGILRKLLSMNCGAICVDQIETVTENVFLGLKQTLRRPGSRQSFYATANPLKNWVYKRWLKKLIDYGEKPEDYFELGAVSDENPYLSESYLNTLRTMPEAWRKRYYEAKWEDPGGLVYPFKESVHVVRENSVEIPTDAKFYEMVDYGVRVTVFLWVATFEDKIYFFKELWSENKSVNHNAELIKAHRAGLGHTIHNKTIEATYTCPRAFQVESDKRTPADHYAEHGIYLHDARIHFNVRYQTCYKLIENDMIIVSENCKRLIGELETYAWPDVPVEDVKAEKPENQSNFHAVEAFERGLGWLYQGKQIGKVDNYLEKDKPVDHPFRDKLLRQLEQQEGLMFGVDDEREQELSRRIYQL